MLRKFFITVFAVFIFSGTAYAMHPLITDDAGTEGKGGFLLEVNFEYGHDDENGTKTDTFDSEAILNYGILNNTDIILTVPHQYIKTRASGTEDAEDGITDLSMELKWRFFEKNGLSVAAKPVVFFPSGDEKKGLGAGRLTYGGFIIATLEKGPWAFHYNLGYTKNENKVDEKKDIWETTLAVELELMKSFKAVGDIGIKENAEKTSNVDPAFILGGFVYSLTKHIDIDVGVKTGLTQSETDYSILTGVAISF
jgi:hypothetical protein